jgi:serine/threonine-protein kinase ULK4
MDNYHIYEELGRGTNSIVYKGRKKKSIEYVAVKCVEKGMMEKVLNEVQIMHKLECPHTLSFDSWYETRNHIWMIVEYCAGGNLLTVLQQDLCLPEASARTFGLDVVTGLQYLHSVGVLFCDLKPSNLLLDEFGVIKLANFRLARRIPTRQNAERTAQMKRGTPCYMAPELFSQVGSVFWCLVTDGH